ncbi:MAG: aldehyde dehydrogenase family protein [Bacteroidia bacterium]|nr:aldehyde dehydrogenase family protein [Bacteroidia bacterium]
MEKEDIINTLNEQRRFFASGITLDKRYRLEMLRQLRSLIVKYEPEIIDAMWKDFHKPEFEVVASETRLVILELNHAIRNLSSWSGKRRVRSPLVHFLSWSYIRPQPYGQVLILSPWNFPFQLAFIPLVGAIAAGNCVIMKMSQQVPNTMAVMERLLENMPKGLVTMINGDHSISDFLLDHKFDYIFFTGSPRIGRHVMKKAAENLVPLSLELGGKNPCVVCSDARLDFAAKRIAWGKFLNGGQTCVAPDYVLVDKKVKTRFLENIKREIEGFYGSDPKSSSHLCRVLNQENVNRLSLLMKKGTVVTGGITDSESCYVAPTVLADVKPSDPVMEQEIFGPLLPVIEFEKMDAVYDIINQNPKPLAAYIFTSDRKNLRDFMTKTQSGTVAINDTVIQFVSPHLPFGGIGPSGLGRYHGRKSFETFSNMRSVIRKSTLFDIPLRYAPYKKIKSNIIKRILSL